MPVNPSPNFMQQFGMQQPQAPVGPPAQQQLPMAQPLLPSWMRTGAEGGIDALLGLLGVGPESKMNQVGQMAGAAIPMMGGIGLASRIKPAMQAAPEAGEIGSLISEMSNNLRKVPGGQNPIYDEAGRFLAMERPDDPAYLAHVASSRNKNVLPPKTLAASLDFSAPHRQSIPSSILPSMDFTQPARQGFQPRGYAPNVDQLEELMKKYKK